MRKHWRAPSEGVQAEYRALTGGRVAEVPLEAPSQSCMVSSIYLVLVVGLATAM